MRTGLCLCLTCLLPLSCGPTGEGPTAPANAGAADAAPDETPAPDVVWIVVDSLRADHADTPAIERLAQAGHRFPRVYAHSPSALPAHVAMLSSRRPVETGVVRDGQAVEPELPLLPAWLAEHGYRTAAVVSLEALWPPEPGTGIDRGFERFERCEAPVADAAEVLERARALLDALDDGGPAPFFLFVQLADPHPPLRAHGTTVDTAEIFLDGEAQLSFPVAEGAGWWGDLKLPPGQHVVSIKSILPLEVESMRARLELEDGGSFEFGAPPGSPDLQVENVAPQELVFRVEIRVHDRLDPGTAQRRYRLEVEQADRAVGALLDELERRGLYDDALVLLTADHGLALGEREGGYVGADRTLFDELVHVPWVLKPPRGAEHPLDAELARARDKLLRQIDQVPTVLELAGLPKLPGQVGSSVFQGTLRVVLAEAHPPLAAGDRFSLRDESLKLVLDVDEERFRMFDLREDPGETRDVFGARGGEKLDWQGALKGTAAAFRGRGETERGGG